MLENAERDTSDTLDRLDARLQTTGAVPKIIGRARGGTAGGVPLRVSVTRSLDSNLAAGRSLAAISSLVAEGVPVTLSLTDLGSGDKVSRSLDAFCRRARASLPAEARSSGLIGTCLHSHQLPLRAYLLICDSLLGGGPRYVCLDSLQMQHHGVSQVEEETECNWTILWRHRQGPGRILPVYGACVRTPCPLLADEAAGSVLPEFGIHVPVETAWLPIDLPLPAFSDGHGRLDWIALHDAITACCEIGEQMLDWLCWPVPAQRSDAWLNRRMAILVSGIGDLVYERGDDPSNLACLERTGDAVARIHTELWDCSRSAARDLDPVPALARFDPSMGWDDAAHREDWNRRWSKALSTAAVRNRNLLVMSPYSVLPSAQGSPARFGDLLPLLEHADAYSFAEPPDLGGWKLNEFKSFHRRSWAIMQRQKSASFVAAGV